MEKKKKNPVWKAKKLISEKISIFLMMDLIIPPKFSTENHNSAGYWSQSAGKEDFLESADDV